MEIVAFTTFSAGYDLLDQNNETRWEEMIPNKNWIYEANPRSDSELTECNLAEVPNSITFDPSRIQL